jgi:hypothetical protein
MGLSSIPENWTLQYVKMLWIHEIIESSKLLRYRQEYVCVMTWSAEDLVTEESNLQQNGGKAQIPCRIKAHKCCVSTWHHLDSEEPWNRDARSVSVQQRNCGG